MDIRQRAAAACVCFLAAAPGCTLRNAEPAVRPDEGDGSPDEQRSQVVQAANADDVISAADVQPDMAPIRRWIEQIRRRDDVRSRVGPQPAYQTFGPVAEDAQEAEALTPAGEREADDEPSQAEPVEAETAEPQVQEVPVLGEVSVHIAASPPLVTRSKADVISSVNAPEQSIDTPLGLSDFAEQWLSRPADPSFRSQIDQRIVQVLAGKYEDARRPLDVVSDEQQQMASHFVEALIAIREAHAGEPAVAAERVLAQLEQLEDSLLPLSDLRIPRLALARAVRGFGRYEAFEPPEFLAGRENEFVVYCEIANFESRLRDDGRYESQFSMRTAVLGRNGDLILEINDEHIADECRTRRRDCFIPRLVRLPATLSPGEYVIKVTIIDRIGQKVAEKRATFRIVARS
jgi:hypothetical protein